MCSIVEDNFCLGWHWGLSSTAGEETRFFLNFKFYILNVISSQVILIIQSKKFQVDFLKKMLN